MSSPSSTHSAASHSESHSSSSAPAHSEGHAAASASKGNSGTPAAPASHGGGKDNAGTPAAPASHDGRKANSGTPAAPASHNGGKANAGKPAAPARREAGEAKAGTPSASASHEKGKANAGKPSVPAPHRDAKDGSSKPQAPDSDGSASAAKGQRPSSATPGAQAGGAPSAAGKMAGKLWQDFVTSWVKDNRGTAANFMGFFEGIQTDPAFQKTLLNAFHSKAAANAVVANPGADVLLKSPEDSSANASLDAQLKSAATQAAQDMSTNRFADSATKAWYANLANLNPDELRLMALYSLGNRVESIASANPAAADSLKQQLEKVLSQGATDPAQVNALLQQANAAYPTDYVPSIEGLVLDNSVQAHLPADVLSHLQMSLAAVAHQPGADADTVQALEQMFQAQIGLLQVPPAAASADSKPVSQADFARQAIQGIQNQLAGIAVNAKNAQTILMLQLEMDTLTVTGGDFYFTPTPDGHGAGKPVAPHPVAGPKPAGPAQPVAGPEQAAGAPAAGASPGPAATTPAPTSPGQPRGSAGGPRATAPVTLGQVRQHVLGQSGDTGQRIKTTDASLVEKERQAGFNPDKLPASAALEHLKALEVANRAHAIQQQLDNPTGKAGTDANSVQQLQQELAYLNGPAWTAAVADLDQALGRLPKTPAPGDPSWGAPDPLPGDDGSALVPALRNIART
jgi:hypothetical protein